MARLKTITYGQLKKWLKRNHYKMTVFTLGGTSFITIVQLEDDSICITGSNGKSILIGESTWEHAMSYVSNIPDEKDTWKTATYARPHVVCPELANNMNFGPSFPAIWAILSRYM